MIPKEILDGLVRSTYSPASTGGQSCGIMPSNITLTHNELGFSVTVNAHRSQLKNYDLAMFFFEQYYRELNKEERYSLNEEKFSQEDYKNSIKND